MEAQWSIPEAGAAPKSPLDTHATDSPTRNDVDRYISHHSPRHPSKPVAFIPSSSCWQTLSYSFHPKSRPCNKGDSESSSSPTRQPSFLREAPDEILDIILLHSVRGHQDLRKLALTCHRWSSFSCDDQPWKRLAVRAWGTRSDIVQVAIKKDACGHDVSWKEYYCSRIRSHLPELSYMMSQQNMTVSIRSILINWLLAVIDEFQQEDEEGVFYTGAHHQTVAILDNYCRKIGETLQTSDLQMIGAACAVLALHEGVPLSDIDMSYFKKASFYTDGACTAEEVLSEAHRIVDTLGSSSIPAFETPCEYIDTLLTAMQKNYSSSSTYCLAHYLGELALQAECSLKNTPLVIGASVYALACHTLGWAESVWMPIIRANTHIRSLREIMDCSGELQGLLRQALAMLTRRSRKMTLPHVVVKYSRKDKQHVAKVIVTDSAWPVVCPHGCDRDQHEHCGECEREEQAEGGGGLWEEEENDDNVNPAESLNTSMSEEGEEEEKEEAHAESSPAARPHVEMQQGGAGATPREVAYSGDRILSKTPTNTGGGGGGGGDLGDEGTAPSVGEGAMPEGGGSREGRGLEDVSFGTISEGHDNSFGSSVLDSSMGAEVNDRRQSFGSVLGKVFEEGNDGEEGMEERSAAGDSEMEIVEAAVGDISIEPDADGE